MPLIKAQCTNCGAALEVDQDKEAAICPYCNTPYIVEKAVNLYQTKIIADGATINISGMPDPDSLMQRVKDFLEEKDWNKASMYCDRVLDQNPKCAEAFLGKMMAELRVTDYGQLKNCSVPFDDNINYKRAITNGLDKNTIGILNEALVCINNRNEEAKRERIYGFALIKIQQKTKLGYSEAIKLLESIGNWKDSEELLVKCRNKLAWKNRIEIGVIVLITIVLLLIAFVGLREL